MAAIITSGPRRRAKRQALAVACYLRKARLFLLGCPNLLIITDLRPLVKLLGNRELKDVANPRLFVLKKKTLQYKYQIRYLEGKRNFAHDFLSRYPILCSPPDVTNEEQVSDVVTMAAEPVAVLDSDDHILVLDSTEVMQAAAEDQNYQLLIAKVTTGDWHLNRAQQPTYLRQIYGLKGRLVGMGW
ncbi:hypothetical protein E2C01_083277 [Portunus trituberculatus]|uniref:Reverse transcriptase RNase H-like domain-containing protein n=1 Tax=Portunus trituberculatus TaxID=210409 RepID=A0A5B7J327_PORTR|nr:hypothetical protein [Portunus trituberculatus]